jgi:hypothetical protein
VKATALTDPAAVSEVAEKFGAKYGELDRYYPKRDVAVLIPLEE